MTGDCHVWFSRKGMALINSLVEQGLKNINFNYYKIFNRTAKKTLKTQFIKLLNQLLTVLHF